MRNSHLDSFFFAAAGPGGLPRPLFPGFADDFFFAAGAFFFAEAFGSKSDTVTVARKCLISRHDALQFLSS